jgi:acyl carrier protein
MNTRRDVAPLIRRLEDILRRNLPEEDLDLDASLFKEDGVEIAGQPLDSFDLVEIFITLEDDLSVSLQDMDDIAEVDTIARLWSYLGREAPPEVFQSFAERWAS